MNEFLQFLQLRALIRVILFYKKVKIYTSGNGIVTCYRVNGKEISTVTIQLSVKFTKQGNKVLLNNISIDNILGI